MSDLSTAITGPDPNGRARSVLDAVAVGYLVTERGRIVEANRFLCELLGFEPEELVGSESPWPFIPPDEVEVGRELAARMTDEALLSRAGYSAPVELPLQRSDGTRFAGEVMIAPARGVRGEVAAWVLTVRALPNGRKDELERLTRLDLLTGLPNRRLFDERLDQEMANAVRHQRSLAVALLELEGLSPASGSGRGRADPAFARTLSAAADRLGQVKRQGDLLARVGAERFAWILPDAHPHGARAAAERARHVIADSPFDGIGGRLTLSIGVALRGELTEAGELYEHTLQALAQAAREGRDSCVLWRFDQRL